MAIPEHLLKRRWSVAVIAALLAAVGLVATVASRWTHDTLFDTDSWVETVGPIGTDPIVVEALGERVADELIEWLNTGSRIEEALPTVLDPLALLFKTQIDDFILTETTAFFESDIYEGLWEGVNRTAHSAAVAIIRDEVPLTSTEGGVVTVDLTPLVMPIVDGVVVRLEGLGEAIPDLILDRVEVDETIGGLVDSYEEAGLPGWMSEIEVFSSERLASIQTATATLDRLVWVLPVLTMILLVAALYWAPNRSRMTAVLLGLGGLGWLASWLAINGIVSSIVGAVESAQGSSIARQLLDGITGGFEGLLLTLFVLAVVGGGAILGYSAYQAVVARRNQD